MLYCSGFVIIPLLFIHGGPVGPIVLFEDLEVQGGFRLSAVASSMTPVETGTVLTADEGRPSRWRLAQWGTRHSLETAAETRDKTGMRRRANAAKEVKVFPGGLGGEGIWLSVNGKAEYGDTLRAYGEAWPHLLIEQQLDGVFLKRFQSVQFSVAFMVSSCVSATDKPQDPGLHTAHLNAFWTVHNLNAESGDHRDMIWFGVPLFDVRHPIPPGHQALDAGQDDATGKFICSMPGDRFFSGPVEQGLWHSIDCDLLPLLTEALEASQSKGFLLHTRIGDLALTSFNLGWEVPGNYICAAHIRGLNLVGHPKVDAVGKEAPDKADSDR